MKEQFAAFRNARKEMGEIAGQMLDINPMFEMGMQTKPGEIQEDIKPCAFSWLRADNPPKDRGPVIICLDGRGNVTLHSEAHFQVGVFECDLSARTKAPKSVGSGVICDSVAGNLDVWVSVGGWGLEPMSPRTGAIGRGVIPWKYVSYWAPINADMIPWHSAEDPPIMCCPMQEECVGSVYIIRSGNTSHYKIGYTGRDIGQRMSEIQTGSPLPLSLVASWTAPRTAETKIHRIFSDCRLEGEWFDLTVDRVLAAMPKITALLD